MKTFAEDFLFKQRRMKENVVFAEIILLTRSQDLMKPEVNLVMESLERDMSWDRKLTSKSS